MKVNLFVLPLFFVSYASCLIIPEELSSLLSVAYSNIPPIKKGTDSRVGFGFALGNHADFQVLFELGPQTNTAKIGSSFASNSKRHVSSDSGTNKKRQKLQGSEANKYLLGWANSMNEEQPSRPAHPQRPGDTPNLEESLVDLRKNEKGEYEIRQPPPPNMPAQRSGDTPNLEESLVDLRKNEKGEYEIRQPPPPNMPAQVLYQLQKLYGQNAETAELTALDSEQTPRQTDLSDNYERLSQFRAPTRTSDELRRVTAELSDVDLD